MMPFQRQHVCQHCGQSKPFSQDDPEMCWRVLEPGWIIVDRRRGNKVWSEFFCSECHDAAKAVRKQDLLERCFC